MPLTSKQAQVATLIGGGHSQAEAARAVGVNPATIWRWMHKPEFTQAVRNAEDAAVANRLREVRTPALEVLAEQLGAGNDPYVRQNAARDLLTRAGITGAQDKQAAQVQIVFVIWRSAKAARMTDNGRGLHI